MDNRGEDRRKRPEGRSEFSRPAGARDDRRPDGFDRGRKPGFARSGEGRGPRPERNDRSLERPRGPRNRELAAVQEADEELLRLVMRRARWPNCAWAIVWTRVWKKLCVFRGRKRPRV